MQTVSATMSAWTVFGLRTEPLQHPIADQRFVSPSPRLPFPGRQNPTKYAYDALGRMTNLTDGLNQNTGLQYDSMGRLIRKTHSDGSFYAYGYNARGWLTNRMDALNRWTAYGYDSAGQLANVDYQVDGDVTCAYDILGRQTSRVDNAGTWAWTYDGDSSRRLSETVFRSDGGSSTVSYAYHANTYELAAVSLDGTTVAGYDWSQGRLTNVWTQTGNFAYNYKPNSDLLETTIYPNGAAVVTRAYDLANRLLSISTTNSAGYVNSFAYSLDNLGRRTRRTDADGSSLDWGYDSRDQLVSASLTNACPARGGGAADAAYKFGYQYDLAGNRLHEDRGQQNLDGTFNVLNQLIERGFGGKLDVFGSVACTNPPFAVKVNGRDATLFDGTNFLGGSTLRPGSNVISIVTRDVSSNATETVQAVFAPPANPQRFFYDPNGNLTNDGMRAYFWDQENRLVAIECLPGLAGIERRRSEYRYDAQWRRARKVDLSGWDGAAYATTNVSRYVWDDWLLIGEVASVASGATTNWYSWGLDLSGSLQGAGGIGGLLCATKTGTGLVSTAFYTFDGNGNVTEVLDTNGVLIAQYEYDPFGRVILAAGPSAPENAWRFSTKQTDGWGLCYYGYRYYQSDVGRWLSRDPISEESFIRQHTGTKGIGTDLLYAFSLNDPVCLVDLLGLDYLGCLSRCVQRFQPSTWVTDLNLVNSLLNALCGMTPRGGISFPRHWSSWQHRLAEQLASRLCKKCIDKAGRFIGRAALVPIIAEGFYDWGSMTSCGIICALDDSLF